MYINKISRKITYFKEDSKRSTSRFFFNLWNSAGKTGLAFLNFIPVLGKTFISSIGKLLTNLFNEIYNQKISSGKATRVIVSFLLLLGVVTIVYSGVSTLKDFDKKVNRTKKRPLAAGKITIKQSLAYVLLLCLAAFFILIQFWWLL